ncbi:MAG: Lrp/AsnC family transcriptional regulator [Gammaproteobacteria bacterium]|nr:Lrp/AsnC family transcriptional regulator [Gammaproteobacteria bacterium]
MKDLDKTDERLLEILQRNATITMQELGSMVGLSHTPCWRRVRRLEERGYISRRVTLLDPEKLELNVNVFVFVTLSRHQSNALTRFENAVKDIPEIVECYSVSGQADFLLRVIVHDVSAYDLLLKRTLIHLPEIGNLNSTIALQQVKYSTELPLESR